MFIVFGWLLTTKIYKRIKYVFGPYILRLFE